MNPFQDFSILRMEFGLDINTSLTVVPEETLQAEVWTYVTLLSALILPILVLNIIVIVAIWKQRSLRTGSNIFIISLAMADICIALFVIPGHISGQFSEDWVGNMICKVCSYSSFTGEAAAVISLTAISLDRVRSVAFPLKPKPTKQQAGILILGIWVASLLFGLRGAMTFALSHVFVDSHDGIIHTRALCFMNSTDEVTNRSMMALDFVFLFTIPALVVGISYTAILCIASRHMQRMKSTQRDNQNGPGRIKLKAVRMSVMVISIFVVLHLPDHVLMMYASRDGALIPNSMTIIRVFHLVAFLNSVLNPIFYGFLNPKIRVGLKKLFKRRSDLNESCCCCSWCSIWKSQSRSSGSSGSSQWQMFKHKLGAKKDSSGSKETQIVHLDGCEEPKEELNQHHKKPLS